MLAYRAPTRARNDPTAAAELCRQVRCPVLVIGDDEDMCQPSARSRAVAELTGGELVVLQGGGHLPNARDPVKVNLEIDRFLRRIELGCPSTTRGRAPISWTLVAAG